MAGANIETYLLEKVRLIHPGANERNYHVFYQFLSDITERERRDFFLEDYELEDFRLLSQSGEFGRRDGVSDKESHREMLNAMVRITLLYSSVWLLVYLFICGLHFAFCVTFNSTPREHQQHQQH